MAIEPFDRIPGRKAEVDIDLEQHDALVKLGTTAAEQVALTDAQTDDVLGVVGSSKSVGDYVTVLRDGYYEFRVDGAVSLGDRLVPSGANAGRVTASDDPDHTFVGYALQDGADGDVVQCEFRKRPDKLPKLTLSPGAEGDQVADAFDVGLAQNLADPTKYIARAYSQDGTRATDIDLSLQDGNGTEINDSAGDLLIFTLHTDGTETLRVLDGSGALAADVELVLEPLDVDGVPIHQTLPFA